jgi:endonuclease/exonuclease/phosphatase family metal-dependent hydrolase
MRTGRTADWEHLLALSPDVAFLQESHGPENLGAELLTGLAPDRFLWRAPAHGRWGTALVLPRPPVEALVVPDYEGWVVGATVDLWPNGPLCALFSIHVPPRHSGYVRTVEEILDRIQGLRHAGPMVIAGDLNVAAARRVAEEERTNTRGEIRLLDRVEREFGLANAWVVANPNAPLAQTLRWARNPVTPYHCDGIFVPAPWSGCIRGATIPQGDPWRRISDHNPVIVDLDVEALAGASC